jgi:hypothetical protein
MSPAERCDEILRLIDQELVQGAAGDGEAYGSDDAILGDLDANRMRPEKITQL